MNKTTFPNKKYNIIYADPPWLFKIRSPKGGKKSASVHYNVMTIQDICNLDVSSIADTDCVLFMWATYPNLQEAFKVITAWGFTYKTVGFTWMKVYNSGSPVCGLGYWTRANAEICLLATKGSPRRVNNGVYQALIAPKHEHSRKPYEIRSRIVTLMGDLPRIELFAREQIKGWDTWGLESNKKQESFY